MSSTLNITNVTKSSIIVVVFNDIGIIITIAGFFANLFCIIVFSMINRTFNTNGQMYKYLLMKSIQDICIIILFAMNLYYYLCSHRIRNSFTMQFCYIYLYHFLSSLIKLYSTYFEVLGTIDCYLSIENKHKKILARNFFKLSSSFVFAFFFIFYFAKLFVYKIVEIENHEFNHVKTPLYFSLFYRTLSFIYLFFRDILGSFLCIYFNILIFLNIKKMSEKKKHLRNNLALIKSIEAQENKVKMIYFSTVNQVILHIPDFIVNTYGKYMKSQFWENFSQIKGLVLVSSYATPFLIYVIFNKKFRYYFLKFIRIK
jgi:hypothetical protein